MNATTGDRKPSSSAPDSSAQSAVEEIIAEMLSYVRTQLATEVAFVSAHGADERICRHVNAARHCSVVHMAGGQCEPGHCVHVENDALQLISAEIPRASISRRLPGGVSVAAGTNIDVPLRLSDGRLFGSFCCFNAPEEPVLRARTTNTLQLFAGFAARLLEKQVVAKQNQDLLFERMQTVIAQSRFSMVFQPIWDIRHDCIVGYEALARFAADPRRPPDEWFAEAAEVGLQVPLEMAVIDRALEALALLPSNTYLALNVSPATLLSGSLNGILKTLPLDRIVVELTEHESIEDYGPIVSAIEGLRRNGLRLSVDDAGAGYASFRHILQLEPDMIKLDRSLISEIDRKENNLALAAALVTFADKTGKTIIAEGVETEAELEILRGLGVERAQGYFLGRPASL